MSRAGGKRADTVAALQKELRSLGVQMGLLNQAVAERLGLNRTDLEVLTLLYDQGAQAAGQLAQATGLTTGAVTGVIDRLESRGFLRRESDPADRRRVVVQPVLDRAARVAELYEPLQRAAVEVWADFRDEELGRLVQLLGAATPALRSTTGQLRAAAAPVVREEAGQHFGAPLEAVRAARFTLAGGVGHLQLDARDDLGDQLFEGECEGRPPKLRVAGGSVSLTWPRFRPLDFRKQSVRVTLNAAVPWDLEFHGGMTKTMLDLQALELRSLEISAGISETEVQLPAPKGEVRLRFSWGASGLTVGRPVGAPCRVKITGGASELAFDRQRFGAVGGLTQLESPDFARAEDRYDIEITGGASKVSVVERGAPAPEPAPRRGRERK